MTLINGKIASSAGNPIAGTIKVTLDAMLLNGDELLVQKSDSFTIANTGLFEFELEQSETSQITYYFQILGTDQSNLIEPFHAVVPNIEAVNFWELKSLSALTDLLPAGLHRIAQIIATTPEYAIAVSGLKFEGDYNPNLFYSYGSVVSFDGESYAYIKDTLSSNKRPDLYDGSVVENEVYWQKLSERGKDNGSNPFDEPFSATGWVGLQEPPTKNSLASVIINRQAPTIPPHAFTLINQFAAGALLSIEDLKTFFATLLSPTFTGDPKAPTKGIGDGTTSLATCKHVLDSLAAALVPYRTTTLTDDYILSQRGKIYYGTIAPTDPVAKLWVDTSSTPTLKLRNVASTAWITLGLAETTNLGLAALASPALTGTPTAPTAALGVKTTQLATTAGVYNIVADVGTWFNASLVNGWANFGGIYSTAQYKKRNDGRVYLKGFIIKSSTAVVGQTIFSLPSGFRPPNYFRSAAIVYNSTAANQFIPGLIDIDTSGNVSVTNTANISGQDHVTLDNVSFEV